MCLNYYVDYPRSSICWEERTQEGKIRFQKSNRIQIQPREEEEKK